MVSKKKKINTNESQTLKDAIKLWMMHLSTKEALAEFKPQLSEKEFQKLVQITNNPKYQLKSKKIKERLWGWRLAAYPEDVE